MPRVRPNKTGRKNREVKRAAKTKAKTKDLDQIEEDLRPENIHKLLNQELDPDLPGLGQYYCVECAKYFQNEKDLGTHKKTKVHKRRLKLLKEPAYTQKEAELAAGLKTDNGKREQTSMDS